MIGHVARMGELRCAYNILVGKPDGQRLPGADGKTILEWILQKQGGKAWTGCIWLRIGTSGELL
jgi:hypothetical protein